MRDAGSYLAERYVEGSDLAVLEEWEERMAEAAKRESRAAYRAAVRGWVEAGLAAFEAAKKKGAA